MVIRLYDRLPCSAIIFALYSAFFCKRQFDFVSISRVHWGIYMQVCDNQEKGVEL